jgi:hypothetical protein
MPAHVSNSELQRDLKQPVRGVRISAVLSAAIHAFLWGCVVLSMAFLVPRWASVFEDLGVELTVSQAIIIDVSHLTVRLWPFGLAGVIAAAVADWWILGELTTQSSRSLARFWFWGNVALPILVAIMIGVIVATSMLSITQDLS